MADDDDAERTRRAQELRRVLQQGPKQPGPKAGSQSHKVPPPSAPPVWFTLFAAVVPAAPFCIWLPFRMLFTWLPAWVAAFYILGILKVVANRTRALLLFCFIITFCTLSADGWPPFSLLRSPLVS